MKTSLLSRTLVSPVANVAFLRVLGALAVLIVVPAVSHNQYVTGPIVNATLLLTALTVGLSEAILLGLVPSLIALLFGLLPLPLAPVIPFIMVSNSVYTYMYTRLQHRTVLAISVASVAKFAFLSLITTVYFSHILPAKVVPSVQAMMSYPQLLTALIGGLIAGGIKAKFLKQ